ncbi:hypothetical protein PIS_061 [Saccharomonospora phage PIS 136]|nr:hypothetical protein PIS_061 [Saccharomonospora phage PIS 136]
MHLLDATGAVHDTRDLPLPAELVETPLLARSREPRQQTPIVDDRVRAALHESDQHLRLDRHTHPGHPVGHRPGSSLGERVRRRMSGERPPTFPGAALLRARVTVPLHQEVPDSVPSAPGSVRDREHHSPAQPSENLHDDPCSFSI